MTKWNNNEILFLKNNYGKISITEISNELNRDIGAIRMKAIDLKLKINKNSRKVWSLEEIKFLEENYFIMNLKELAEKLFVTYDCLIHKAKLIGVKKRIAFVWTDELDKILIENYPIGNLEKINSVFKNISKNIINKRISFLKLKADSHWWNEKDIELLKKVYPHYSNDYLSRNYFKNRKPQDIRTMGNKLNLNKTKEKGMKWYDPEEILIMLKNLSVELNRTPLASELIDYNLPSSKTYERYFGGYRAACEIIGLKPNLTLFGVPLNVCLSKNNDKCDSYSEVFITNFFIENNIKYLKDKRYNTIIDTKEFNTKRFDWYLTEFNIVVEYFGMMGNKDYEDSVKIKISLCEKYNIKLFPIYPKQLSLNFLKKSFL